MKQASQARKFFIATTFLAAISGSAWAWGPHPDITRAAVETLDANAAVIQLFANELHNLCDNSSLPDWRRSLRHEKTIWFFTDDYLLFPGTTSHLGHMAPSLKETYGPYFRRALQAMRTENAANAEHWVGAILHFAEDTGAPPHAADIRGDLHTQLENWADHKNLHIAGYHPKILGETDEEALAEFIKRLDGLTAFSKLRAERAKPFAQTDDRASVDPILIESAQETSRLVADVLLTFGELANQTPPGGAALRGTVASRSVAGLEQVPAKVMLLGTPFSTLADPKGRYLFHHIPASNYTLAVLRPGNTVATEAITLSADKETVRDVTLAADAVPMNMVRNAEMRLKWLSPDRPDCWTPGKTKSKQAEPCWEGEPLPLKVGESYRFQVAWQTPAGGKAIVRIFEATGMSKPPLEIKTLASDATSLDFTATKGMAYAQVVIVGADSAEKTCKHVAFWNTGAAAGKRPTLATTAPAAK